MVLGEGHRRFILIFHFLQPLTISDDLSKMKTHRDENFPVASFLFSKKIRHKILDFYYFARSADDIADHLQLSPLEKLGKLRQIDKDLEITNPPYSAYGKLLLKAFHQDITKSRYLTWDELLAYCQNSAVPVGRFLLDIHGETAESHHGSDSLCIALQILNHLQDCKDDYGLLNRIYLPQDDLIAANATEAHLELDYITPELRKVLDQILNRIELLLLESHSILFILKNKRLRLETAIIITMAEGLSQKLRKIDPLSQRVKFSKLEIIQFTIKGFIRGLFPRKTNPSLP